MERREFVRVPLRFPVEMQGADRQVLGTRTSDLSLRGVYLECTRDYREGEDCELRLRLGEEASAPSIEIVGRVVRCRDGGLAVEFVGIKGLESLEHLRRLILFNAEDPAEAEEQILARRGIERLPPRE
jgi:hypothetical protein